jgi:HlyD family secretion protein
LELKSLDFNLKSAKRRLECQEEELRQIEEMYKADEVTEETEEIILTRARNSVEMARFMYEIAKLSHAKSLKYELPRTDEAKKEALAQAEIAWQSARRRLPCC